MTNLNDEIKAFRKILRNSDRPLETDDPYYVPDLHGTQAEDVVQRLFDAIDETESTGLYYFTGQRGTGKSTELLRLKKMLDDAGKCCVLLDSQHYLNDTEGITAELLMLMVAAGLADWIKEKHPAEAFDEESSFSRFTKWLQTEVSLERVEVSVGVFRAVTNLKASQPSVQEKIRQVGSRQRFHEEVIAFISSMCGWLQEREKREVVLLVDSLERLRASAFAPEDINAMYRQVAEVFSDRLDLLKVPALKITYSVPPYLCFLQNVRAQVPLFSLASVRVFENPQIASRRRQPRITGVAHMQALLGKRYPGWERILSPEAVDRLALLSGGDVRQFVVRILIDALAQMQYLPPERLPLQADDPLVQGIEDSCRQEMLQLTVRDEWPLLRSVAQDHNPIAQSQDQLPVLAGLMEVKAILSYRNGGDWYDLPPTLWKAMAEAASANNAVPA